MGRVLEPPRYSRAQWSAVAGIVAAAAALRFATLDLQSFGQDELVTNWLLDRSFSSMLSTFPDTEATPPLYYILAWLWSRPFGLGEVGLRSLSALLGTLTVLAVAVLNLPRLSPRVPLAAAALVASSPLLTWYSQEARAYALFALFAAISFVLTVRIVGWRRTRGAYVAWTITAVLMLGTHYFAVLLVAAEFVWLARAAPRRWAALTGGVPAVAWLALLPLELTQRDRQFGDQGAGSLENVLRLPKQLIAGGDSPADHIVGAVGLVLAALLLFFALWTGDDDRRLMRLAGVTGAVSVVGGVTLSVLGVGFLSPRYFVGAVIPCLIALAPGMAMSRRGVIAGGLLCLLGVGISISIALSPTYQRVDYREAAEAIGPAQVPRAIVLTPGSTFQVYQPGMRNLTRPELVREIDVIGLAYEDAGIHTPSRVSTVPIPAGFRLISRDFERRFTVLRYGASSPRYVGYEALRRARLARDQDEFVLFQPRSGKPPR